MAINFTKNVEQYTTTQKNSRVKHFMEFTSKKQLEEADILNAQELEFVKSIKGTFSFALHEEERYMAITLYKASNSERKYNFLIVDLQEQAIAEVDSIKNAKAEILEQVLADKANSIVEESAETNEPAEDSDVDVEFKDALEAARKLAEELAEEGDALENVKEA